jgi:hypothetical protein
MALCDILIDSDITSKCEDPFYGGYKNIGYIVNLDDIDSWSHDEGVVDEFILKEGKKLFKIQSIGTQPTPTTQTFVKGNFYNKWNNTVNLALLDHSPEAVNNIIKPMSSGARFVVFLEHRKMITTKGDSGLESAETFEVFGLTKGLQLQDGASREEYNEELDGGWNLPLEELGAPVPSYFIHKSFIDPFLTPEV